MKIAGLKRHNLHYVQTFKGRKIENQPNMFWNVVMMRNTKTGTQLPRLKVAKHKNGNRYYLDYLKIQIQFKKYMSELQQELEWSVQDLRNHMQHSPYPTVWNNRKHKC